MSSKLDSDLFSVMEGGMTMFEGLSLLLFATTIGLQLLQLIAMRKKERE